MFVETDLAQKPTFSNLSGKTFLCCPQGGSSAMGPEHPVVLLLLNREVAKKSGPM